MVAIAVDQRGDAVLVLVRVTSIKRTFAVPDDGLASEPADRPVQERLAGHVLEADPAQRAQAVGPKISVVVEAVPARRAGRHGRAPEWSSVETISGPYRAKASTHD